MKSIKEAAGVLAVGLFFSLLTWIMVESYMEEYDLISIHSAEATVVEKTGVKGLFTPPIYYVRAEISSGEESDSLNRVSKSQMEDLEIGGSISGYLTGTTDFSTVRDIVYDSLYYLFIIFIFAFLAFCCLVAFLLFIPALNRLEKKTDSKRWAKRRRKRKVDERQKGWRIAGVVLLVFLFFSGRFVWNFIRKLQPFGKTETEAKIIDQFSHRTFRKYEDSVYELKILFEDQAGNNIQVLKDVTRHTYQQYGVGDKLPITYRNADSYDVFIHGNSIWDLLQSLMFWESYVYIVLLAVSTFVIWAFLSERKDKKVHLQELKHKDGNK